MPKILQEAFASHQKWPKELKQWRKELKKKNTQIDQYKLKSNNTELDYPHPLHLSLKIELKKREKNRNSQMYTIMLNFSLLFLKHSRDPIRSCHLDIHLSIRRQREGSYCNLFRRIRCNNQSDIKKKRIRWIQY